MTLEFFDNSKIIEFILSSNLQFKIIDESMKWLNNHIEII